MIIGRKEKVKWENLKRETCRPGARRDWRKGLCAYRAPDACMSTLVGFMVGVWVVFSVVVSPVCRARVPVVTELDLGGAATEPPEVHIHHFGPVGHNCFVGNSRGGWVICLDRAFWLGPTHENEGLPVGNHFSCCYKEGCKFRFGSRRQNKIDDLGDRKNSTIEPQKWLVFWEEDVCTSRTAGVSFVEKSCIQVGTKDHVTNLIDDAIGRIGSNII